jgi:multidrug efflux system outer membrane protein
MMKKCSYSPLYNAACVVSLLSLSALTSCQLLPSYKGAETPFIPQQWKAPQLVSTSTPLSWKEKSSDENKNENVPSIPNFTTVCKELYNWWEVFNDPRLNELEESALHSSPTLWAALERVKQARAQTQSSWSFLLPKISLQPSFDRTGSLVQNPFPSALANSTTQQQIQNQPTVPENFRFVQSQYLVPLTLNYELDLWGKLTQSYYASLITAQASSQAYLSVLLSLTADIAATYFEISNLDRQQEILQKHIELRKRAVTITTARFKAGIIAYADVTRAEFELAKAQADYDDIHRIRMLHENRLATLIGISASDFSLNFQPMVDNPPFIPAGLPSTLLLRRPDIAEAERRVAASYQQIGVVYTKFFPSLFINASLGVESPTFKDLFTWKARFWQIGFNLFQTLFDAGYNQANLAYYQAHFSEILANYQELVIHAFQEVEDSLNNIQGYKKQANDLAVAVQAAEKTLFLSQMRYLRGLVGYLDTVDAERNLLEAEQTAAIMLGNQYNSTILLIRALGGGWN